MLMEGLAGAFSVTRLPCCGGTSQEGSLPRQAWAFVSEKEGGLFDFMPAPPPQFLLPMPVDAQERGCWGGRSDPPSGLLFQGLENLDQSWKANSEEAAQPLGTFLVQGTVALCG